MKSVEEIIANVCEISINEINDNSHSQSLNDVVLPNTEISNWDSFNAMVIIAEIEKEFNIKIMAEDIQNMFNVSSIKEIIKKYAA